MKKEKRKKKRKKERNRKEENTSQFFGKNTPYHCNISFLRFRCCKFNDKHYNFEIISTNFLKKRK